MSQKQGAGSAKIKLGFKKSLDVLKPYIWSKFVEQVKSVWIIILYLILFQIFILGIPIVYSLTIGLGLAVVVLGLMLFMEGLVLGLMPLGEILGTKLPLKSKLPTILIFAFVLGIGSTFAEPAIAVLKAAGSTITPSEAPLLYSLLNDYSGQIVWAVALGVGVAVLFGVLRFILNWSLKKFVIPLIVILLVITAFAHFNSELRSVIGLAWDCGGVTTGPVTVPLVLALGIGVSRVVSKGGDGNGAGFGIVTLASLFPIIAVMLLGFFHYLKKDYVSITNAIVASSYKPAEDVKPPDQKLGSFSERDLQEFRESGRVRGDFSIAYKGDSTYLQNGSIIVENPLLIVNKVETGSISGEAAASWWNDADFTGIIRNNIINALQAIIPLCIFLFLMLKILRERVPYADEISLGVGLATVGMAIFGIGISLGLTPLGSQLGSNIPSAFARVQLWNMDAFYGPIYSEFSGKIAAMAFAFFLGYGATLAEPALNALGVTVENITVGAFRKSLLMQTVAIGVGIGIALGVLKIAYDIPLAYLLIPPYLLLIPLTLFSSESFVNFAWDSAGVTTGPITVPLVLAMGLGIGANVPGIKEGFGILAMASVMPIICVLTVGILISRSRT